MSEPRIDSCQGKALAVLAAVFVFGAASGAFGHWAFEERHRAGTVELEAPGSLIDIDSLRKELDLTDDQVERVRMILDEIIMLEADLMTQILDARDGARERILLLLNPGQRSKFNDMRKRASAD